MYDLRIVSLSLHLLSRSCFCSSSDWPRLMQFYDTQAPSAAFTRASGALNGMVTVGTSAM